MILNRSINHLYLPDFNPKRCVVKIGSSLLASQRPPYLNVYRMSKYVKQISKLLDLGWEIVLVSSGAVAAGMSVLNFKNRPTKMSQLQACAAVGQVILMKRYARLFQYRKKHCAQLLLTAEDLRSRQRYLNAKNTILELLDKKIVPIVNENDTVSTDEIAFGDNDKLSAMVAGCCDAKILIILSDVDGLYRSVEEKDVIAVVDKIDDKIRCLVKKKSGRTTVGGMASKLEAADLAGKWGIYTIVASGHRDNILIDLLVNRIHKGTVFLPSQYKKALKKMWIAYVATPKGEIIIDEGAYKAISLKGKSLLCAGIIKINGQFRSSDAVKIVYNGTEVGRGLAGMSSQEMLQFLGRRANKEAVHRNNMILW